MAGTFVGGIGLFLLGMRLMTDGLKLAAGSALRNILKRGTGTPLKALLSGSLITGLVQSSSAVTVAVIGFVNAGLLGLGQAVWVVFGSNLGTTMTGWIVALTGLSVDLKPFALPMIGGGMVMRLLGSGKRAGAVGEAVTGFGLFFLGLSIIQSGFSEVAGSADLSAIRFSGLVGSAVYMGVGTLITAATQSSSVSIALTLTAAATGVIDMQLAGAMVVGANLGTTSTAAFASIGATPNARRTAVAHVIFNLVAAAAALVLLPWMLEGITLALQTASLPPAPATSLALFHTAFNILGIALMWPFTSRLVDHLHGRFRTHEEEVGTPQHLDPTVLGVPSVALHALAKEASRLGHVATSLVRASVTSPVRTAAAMEPRRLAFEHLRQAIGHYITRLDRANLPAEVGDGLQALIRANQHYVIAVEQALLTAELRAEGAEIERGSKRLPAFLESARQLTELSDPTLEDYSLGEAERALGALLERYEASRDAHLEDAAFGRKEAEEVVWRQHVMAEIRRAAKHLVRGAEALAVVERA